MLLSFVCQEGTKTAGGPVMAIYGRITTVKRGDNDWIAFKDGDRCQCEAAASEDEALKKLVTSFPELLSLPDTSKSTSPKDARIVEVTIQEGADLSARNTVIGQVVMGEVILTVLMVWEDGQASINSQVELGGRTVSPTQLAAMLSLFETAVRAYFPNNPHINPLAKEGGHD